MSARLTRRQAVLGSGGVLASLGVLSSLTSAHADPEKTEKNPHIHAAVHELKEAKIELEKADHDFGGHKVEAIKAINHALNALHRALKADRT